MTAIESPRRSSSLAVKRVLTVASLGALALGVLCIAYEISWKDNALLVVAAQGLAEGRGLVDVSDPTFPPMVRRAPGFPVLLAPLVWLLGGRYKLYRLPAIAAHALALPLIYRVLRRRTSARGALLIGLLHLSLPVVIWDVYILYPTSIYTLLLLWIVLLEEDATGEWSGRREVSPLLVGGALALSYTLWDGDIAAVGAVVVFHAIGRRWRRAAAVGLWSLLLITPILWRNWAVSGHVLHAEHEETLLRAIGADHIGPAIIPALLRHAFEQAARLPREIGFYLVPLRGLRHLGALERSGVIASALDGLEIAVGLLTIGGMWLAWRRDRSLAEVYGLAFLAIQCVWFVLIDYMIPLVPFFYLYLFRGTTGALRCVLALGQRMGLASLPLPSRERCSPRTIKLTLGALLLLLVIGRDKVYWDAIAWPPRDEGFDRWSWVARDVGAEAPLYTVGIEYPQIVYLYTGRRSRPLARALADAGGVRDGFVLADGRVTLEDHTLPPGYSTERVEADAGTKATLYRLVRRAH